MSPFRLKRFVSVQAEQAKRNSGLLERSSSMCFFLRGCGGGELGGQGCDVEPVALGAAGVSESRMRAIGRASGCNAENETYALYKVA